MAGHGLVDREQPKLARVLFAEVRFDLLRSPLVAGRRDREERLLTLVERSRRIEHRAGVVAQELGRPADLERLVGETDQVLRTAEVLDPLELGAAEVDELLGPRMVGSDRIENTADEGSLIAGL